MGSVPDPNQSSARSISFFVSVAPSEVHSETKLHLTIGAKADGPSYRAAKRTEAAASRGSGERLSRLHTVRLREAVVRQCRTELAARVGEVRRVEQIENFDAELE